MQIDHVLPEALYNKPEILRKTLEDFGLSSAFELNSFENWLPSCGPCNRKKSSSVFEPVPIILTYLTRAGKYAEIARVKSIELVRKEEIGKALNTLERASSQQEISEIDFKTLRSIVKQYQTDMIEALNHRLLNPIDGDPEIFTKSGPVFWVLPSVGIHLDKKDDLVFVRV